MFRFLIYNEHEGFRVQARRGHDGLERSDASPVTS